MNGLMPGPLGMNLQDEVFGWDLPHGFDSFEEALGTCTEVLQWNSLWKVKGKIYELVPATNQNKPFFIPYEAADNA